MITLALYQPDIPQNLGTMMRLAACMGMNVEIIEPCSFPLSDSRLRRAGMDYIDEVVYRRHASWEHFLAWKPENSRIILLSTKASMPYQEVNYQPNDILLVGRESSGVPEEVVTNSDLRVLIPMKPPMRSLNVAISAAMVAGEALRQTQQFPL